MIIDFHTHIFPPEVRENREEYVRRDPTFAEMYANPQAKIATAEDLLASMDEAGVDVSVALGFAWHEHELCVRHNDYLFRSEMGSNGRIKAFGTVSLASNKAWDEIARCAELGFLGLGELRPENQRWNLTGEAGDRLAGMLSRYVLCAVIHVTEPGERSYPGRAGCELETFTEFGRKHDDGLIVGAHLGGGIHAVLGPEAPAIHVDTAALPFLYSDDLAQPALSAVPDDLLLFGSDFPLISQNRQLIELRRVIDDPIRREAALGGNAKRLLGL